MNLAPPKKVKNLAFNMINEELQNTDLDDDGLKMNEDEMALFMAYFIKFLTNKK